jgi:beta-galactosidase
MFDFACPMWKRGGVAARNMKGLVTFDRKTKKDAYYWYKANWSEAPVLYMTERRNTDRETRVTRLTVYSNVGQPRVYLNGRELQGCKKGFTDVHYVFDDVTLVDGENVLRAVAADKQGNELSDEMTWHYSGEKRRTKADAASEKEHSGF